MFSKIVVIFQFDENQNHTFSKSIKLQSDIPYVLYTSFFSNAIYPSIKHILKQFSFQENQVRKSIIDFFESFLFEKDRTQVPSTLLLNDEDELLELNIDNQTPSPELTKWGLTFNVYSKFKSVKKRLLIQKFHFEVYIV